MLRDTRLYAQTYNCVCSNHPRIHPSQIIQIPCNQDPHSKQSVVPGPRIRGMCKRSYQNAKIAIHRGVMIKNAEGFVKITRAADGRTAQHQTRVLTEGGR